MILQIIERLDLTDLLVNYLSASAPLEKCEQHMNYETINFKIEDNVAWLTLNRPEAAESNHGP